MSNLKSIRDFPFVWIQFEIPTGPLNHFKIWSFAESTFYRFKVKMLGQKLRMVLEAEAGEYQLDFKFAWGQVFWEISFEGTGLPMNRLVHNPSPGLLKKAQIYTDAKPKSMKVDWYQAQAPHLGPVFQARRIDERANQYLECYIHDTSLSIQDLDCLVGLSYFLISNLELVDLGAAN